MSYAKQWAHSSAIKRSIAKRNAKQAKQREMDRLAKKVEDVVSMTNKSFRFRLGALLACDGRLGYWLFPNKAQKAN